MDVHRHHKSLALLIFILATYFGASSTKHQRRHHHGEENLIIPRFPRQNNEAPYYHVENGNLPESGNWSPWTTTGECTRSCGGGIAYQTRQCNSYRSDGSESCTGPSKRYFSCNLEECPDTDADFRSQQCSLFNNIPFDETYYNWVPYTKAPNKCELNCMPQGERFYYRHKKQVIDGTPCDDEKLDVCVNGKCLPVGCDHYVGSPTKEDKCRVCGGTGDNCNTERGILDRNDLQVGYNDLLLIPVGAMNIRFRELRPSNNYLAIRNVSGHYYLNGNWRIDFPRSFKFCGSTFHYERRPPGFFAPEIITALGPITEAIYLVILYQERNTGIEYEYSIRKGSVIATDPDGYSWKYDDFSNCSTTCGGGFRLRNVWCAKRKDSTPVSTDLCDPALEPISNQSCAQQACPPKWAVSEWSECTKSCGSDGIQNRTVSCEQISASGQSVKVDNYLCEQTDGSAPNSTQSCNVGLACPKWYIGPWKGCDKLCGDGVQRRDVRCYRKTDGQISVLADSACPEQKPPSEKPCFIRPCEGVDWILSDWTGCENKCGLSTETRSAICATLKGNIYPEKFCKKSKLPSLSRDCQGPLCEHQWYASQWSECSSKCSNGVQTRKVFCGTEKNDSIVKVDNSKCDPSKKYNDTQPCAGTEQCKGDWFAGPWSSCSKPCGGGQMTRKVLCMLENKTVDAKLCDVEKIVFASESCNDKPCGHDEIMPVEPTSTVSEEETEECEEYEDVTKPTVKKKNKARRKRSVEFIDADDTFADEEDAPSNYDFDSFGMLPLNSDQLMHRVRRQVIITTGGDDSSSTSDSTSVSTDSSSISSTSEENSSTLSSSESTDSTVSNDTSSTSEITTLSSGTSLDSRSSEFTTKKGISTEAFNSTTNGAAGATNRSDVTTDTPVNGTKFSVTSTEPGITKKLYDILNSTVSAFLNRTDSITESTLSLLRSTLSFSVSTPSPSSDLSSATEASTVESNSSSTTSSSSESSSTEPTSSSELSSTPTSSSSESSSTEPTLSSSESSSTELTSSSESSSTEPTSSSESSSTELTSSSESSSTEPTSSSESSSTEPTSSSESSSTEPTSSSESSSTEPTSSSESSSTEPTSSSESSSTEPTLSSSESSSTELTSSSESSSTELTSSSESSSTEPTSSSSGPLSSTEPSTELSSSESSSTSSSETTDDITSTTEFSSSISTYFESSSGTSEITSEKVSTSPEYSSESSLSTNDSSTSEMTSIESSSSEGTLSTASLASVTSSLISTTTESSTLESSESTASERSSNTFSVTTELYSTTMNPLLTAVIKEMTTRRCKKKKRKPKCESSEFGCCFDGITSASGPFSAGCESVSTCRDTKYGCCPDEVTPADGPDNSGCPVVPCSETLYGCCPDGVSTAEGNDNEGCPEPTTTISTIITTYSCKTSEFGCCPDGISPAGGPDYSGCFECIEGSGDCDHCNQTKYGCCPDGLSAASGPGYTGCEETSSISSSTEYEYSSTISSSSTEYEYSSTISSSSTEYDYSSTVSSSSTEYDYSSTISTSSTDYLENCTLSKFGCCPDDNTTAALGPNKEGCKAACASSYYGCCDDNVTDAHGPYKEGCCLNTQYGCCPDNRLAASGPNLEGCSCLYTIYGCCPDNVTAAKGPGNEGCGCQYTEFGCCPNKYTAASGPNYEGCDCHTFQFGCCPDGVTTAKGSYNQGCGCENTKYGCCADGKTPATNENRTCTCEASKYGCCPDGINEAQGEHFEGCSNIPLRPSEICILPKDKGPCHDYTVKWFFDPEYSGCNRFWYGGCEGNANRFRSQEECQSTCVQPSGREACFLPKLKGSCDGYFPTWYYDSTAKQCGQFIYSGCLGNNNKFQSREECESLCVEPDKLEACEQEVAPGPCNGTFPRWYYDKASSQCRQFAYGGCKSNANNFLTEAECQQRCSQPGKPRGECYLPKAQGNCTERLPRWFFNQTENRCMPYYYSGCEGNGNNFYFRELCEDICPSKIEQDICTLPALIGECHNYVERWYFDTLASRCRQFYYGGCGGNANNFVSEYSCQTRCQSAQLTTTSTTTAIPPFIVDVCDYPREAGPCSGSYNQWYYDKNADACYEFNYGGCQGNPNRFSDRESCERQCQKTSRQPATAKELTKNITTTTLMPSTSLILSQICYSLVDPGPCIDQIPAWYFDISTGQCRSFLYGGCEGNANRFTSEEECERQCGAFQGKDVCKLPVDIGPCLEGTYKRWYYDEDRLTCFPFIYSGCGGNFNRFKTFQSCLEFCTIQPTQTEKPDIDPRFPTTNKTDSCSTQTADCNILQERCPYGLEKWVDTSNCENCRCYDPCRSPDAKCPEHTQCAIEFHSVSGSKQFKTVCRPVHKVGECPQLEPANRPCTRECNTDADCPKDDKCCTDGCSVFCVKPSLPQVTTASTSTTTEKPIRGQPPLIPGETVESDIQAEEGNYATLKCTALGYPKPNIIWQKDGNIIDRSIGRFILIEDGTLKIIDLYRTDAGIYICIADNGIGDPARREFKLNINDGVDRQADIISDSTASGIVVSLGAPAVLQCYAYGWPRPTVTWWKEDKMLPLSTEQYEQRRDHSLAIRTVTIRSLGPYTCQAYNGIGRATSWSLTLHAVGPTYSIDPQDYDYIKYLVPPPKAPPLDASKKPQPGAASFPHSEINPTPTVASTAAVVTTPRFRVPVSAVISTNQTEYSVGTDISMPCDVDGYPIPTVNWYKDNELLQNNERIRISESNRLLIARITSADSGVYRCVANNGFSSSFSFININIKGVYIAENCTDNPLFANCALIVKAQFCRHQYYAKFCCRACTLAGQLPGFSDRADYRTENDSGQIVKRSIDTGGTSCIDDPFFTRCDLIVKKQYCAQRYYAKLCCKSCATAGHLPMLHNHYEIASAPATKKTNTLI